MRVAVVVAGLLGLVAGCGDGAPPADGPPVSEPAGTPTDTGEGNLARPTDGVESELPPAEGSSDQRALDCEGAAGVETVGARRFVWQRHPRGMAIVELDGDGELIRHLDLRAAAVTEAPGSVVRGMGEVGGRLNVAIADGDGPPSYFHWSGGRWHAMKPTTARKLQVAHIPPVEVEEVTALVARRVFPRVREALKARSPSLATRTRLEHVEVLDVQGDGDPWFARVQVRPPEQEPIGVWRAEVAGREVLRFQREKPGAKYEPLGRARTPPVGLPPGSLVCPELEQAELP